MTIGCVDWINDHIQKKVSPFFVSMKVHSFDFMLCGGLVSLLVSSVVGVAVTSFQWEHVYQGLLLNTFYMTLRSDFFPKITQKELRFKYKLGKKENH